MQLTTQQLQTINSFILADPVLSVQSMDGDGLNFIADALNALAVPSFTVWRTLVTQDEIMQNGFDWTRVDNLSVGTARVWEWMFDNQLRNFNPSKANVRAGIDQVWKGTAADLAVRAAVYVHCKRFASVLEKMFATGTGSDADPATMVVEGRITSLQVDQARHPA